MFANGLGFFFNDSVHFLRAVLLSLGCAVFSPLGAAEFSLISAEQAPALKNMILILEDIRPMGGDAAGNLHLQLQDGDWSVFADYNEKSKNSVQVLSDTVEGGERRLKLELEITADGARRGRKHFPTPSDLFALELSIRHEEESAGIPLDREAFMPWWRKDTPLPVGRKSLGRYSGTWSQAGKAKVQELQGTLRGAWRPAQVNGWSARGVGVLHEAHSGVLAFRAYLPEQSARYGTHGWIERQDLDVALTGASLRLHVSTVEKEDRVLRVAAKTTRGWYQQDVLLRKGNLDLDLSDLGDAWRPFAGEKLTGLRIGLGSYEGLGLQKLHIQDIRIQRTAKPVEPLPEYRVVLRPETAFRFNGADQVQPGLFGFHDVNENKTTLNDAVEKMEQWQPGLLRPLTHTDFSSPPAGGPWKNPDSLFAQRARAGGVEDRVYWCFTSDLWARPAWMDEPKEQFLTKIDRYFTGLAEKAWSPETPENLLRHVEVWNEPFMWGRHINMGFRNPPGRKEVVDPTQPGYLPAAVGAERWSEIFLRAKAAAAEANPHLKLGGPSAPDLRSYNYADFRNYTLRILEQCGDELDFFSEHHYGGNPYTSAAAIEVYRAAMWKLHQKQVPFVNTEVNDLGASSAGKALYNLAEILHWARWQPDLAEGRALHACWSGALRDSGEQALWPFMAPLRGQLIDVSADTELILPLASHPQEGELQLIALYTGWEDARLRLPMPRGFRVADLELFLTRGPDVELQIRDVDGAGLPEIPKGKVERRKVLPRLKDGMLLVDVPGRTALRLRLTRKGYQPSRVREQHMAMLPFSFEALKAGEEQKLPFSGPKYVDRVFLRYVATGSMELHGAGEVIPIPVGAMNSEQAELQMLELPPGAVEKELRLVAGEAGAEILSMSWVWEE